MRPITLAALIMLLTSLSALACGGAARCTVKDPTGAPLHVRQEPDGKIISTLRNKQVVSVIDHQTENGKVWAAIASSSKLGDGEGVWIYRSYVRCTKEDGESVCTVQDPTGSSLNARETPNGKIVGTLRNGERVRLAVEDDPKDGKPWILVFRFAEDNQIGFVFDDYLKCEEEAGIQ